MNRSRKITRLPEISLISSWRVPFPQKDEDIYPVFPPAKTGRLHRNRSRLPGVYHALREGIGVLDLYLLEHREIPLYAFIAKAEVIQEPQKFLASLNVDQLNDIADWLQEQLIEHFHGRGVGRRPRWGGIATFFPSISVPNEEVKGPVDTETRHDAVKALRASLYLAYRLGCRCIEAVGGSRTPITIEQAKPEEYNRIPPQDYVQKRHEALTQSLEVVFDLEDPENILSNISSKASIPRIAMELEPGPSFLLNHIDEYGTLMQNLSKSPAKKYIGLNADIAHFFLCGHYHPADLKTYRKDILHMHLSDHAADYVGGGTHASDLVPGLYHNQEDYAPWLELALKETQRENSRFSGVIAIELEACHSVTDILSAQSTVRRWLASVAETSDSVTTEPPPLEGALLVVDLGHSTENLLSKGSKREGANRLRDLMDQICTSMRKQGGTVLSFTGDGFIGLFEKCYFPEHTASHAWRITQKLAQELQQALRADSPQSQSPPDISLRCALHWGEAYVPNAGSLREQVLGLDVVCTARVCDVLSTRIESALPNLQNRTTYAVTGQFFRRLQAEEKARLELWQPSLSLKGLPGTYRVYVSRGTFTTRKNR
ncbi:MAG: hypothetical protein QM758_06310 [Armatimonas sp.]